MSDYTINHFSLSLPAGENQANIPDLLRHLADAIEEEGRVDVQDITFRREYDQEGGDWPSFTVYFTKD